MRLFDRIKAAGRLIAKGHTYDLNDMWQRGQYTGNVGLRMDTGVGVEGAYAACATAYACIDRISKDVAGVPLLFLSDPEDIESTVSDGDPIKGLFRRPAKGVTTRRLIGWAVMMRQLRGETIWLVEKRGRTATSVNPWIDPLLWKEKANRRDGLYGWTYRDGGNDVPATADEVLWIGQDNPKNPYRGQSPLQAAASALSIGNNSRRLVADMIARGGERGLVLSTDIQLQPDQYEQLLSNLSARRPGHGKATRDMIFDNGLKVENPDLTKEDIDFLAWLGASKDDICQVYGMAPVIIGDDDAAQFKMVDEARRLYWQQTIVPLIRSMEDAFDSYFTEGLGSGTYIRFDLSKVAALQQDEGEKADIARTYADMGISLLAINNKLGLGFDDDDMTAADESNAFALPFDQPEQDDEPEKSLHKGLTNDLIRKRAQSTQFKFARERRRSRLERATWNSYKQVAGSERDAAETIIREAVELHGMGQRAENEIVRGLYDRQKGLGDSLVSVTEPAHREAMQMGQASIQELTDGKALAWHDRVKLVSFGLDAEAVMSKRSNYIRANIASALFDSVVDSVRDMMAAAVEQNESVSWLVSRVRDVYAGWAKGQAATIARTEIGTLYNIGRFEEMGQQGFEHHEWLTSLDEMTRDGSNSEFDHAKCDGVVRRVGEAFPCGLTFPQEDGGDAGNVINCRCETIPVVKE